MVYIMPKNSLPQSHMLFDSPINLDVYMLSCLGSSVGRALCLEYTVSWFESHPRQLIFSRKSDCLGCAVLLCLVCLFDLACFFFSSFSSLIYVYSQTKIITSALLFDTDLHGKYSHYYISPYKYMYHLTLHNYSIM